MNKNNIWILIVVALLTIGSVSYNIISTPKLGFVRALDLVDNYVGMLEARAVYGEKRVSWEKEIDSLKAKLQTEINVYKSVESKLSDTEKLQKEAVIKSMQGQLYERIKKVEDQARLQDEQMTQAVLDKINDYMQQYGKANGFDLIVSTMSDGTVLYAKDALDVTDNILEELNREYSGE